MSVYGRWVFSVDGGERVSVNGTSAWVDDGWRESSDEQALLSIDEERASLGIERSELGGSGENSSWVSLLLLVLLGMYLKIQEKKNYVRNLNKIKSICDQTSRQRRQIWYHSNYPKEWFILSQIRGRVVVLRDRIHRELGNLRNLIWFVKLNGFRDLNVNCSFILNKCLFNRLIEVLVL